MRGNKPYSNATFTKRVDYDGGAHRPARTPKEPAVCRQCGAVYARRRWSLSPAKRALTPAPPARSTLCPACDLTAKGLVRGYLRLEGAFAMSHRAEIERLIRREADRAAEDNPTGRLITVPAASRDAITVAATTEHLIERLARAVRHAYGGEVDFGFSHGNKFARAVWRRDA